MHSNRLLPLLLAAFERLHFRVIAAPPLGERFTFVGQLHCTGHSFAACLSVCLHTLGRTARALALADL